MLTPDSFDEWTLADDPNSFYKAWWGKEIVETPLHAASVSDRNDPEARVDELCPQRTIEMKRARHYPLSNDGMLLRDEYLMARDFIISYAEAHPRNGLVVSGQSGIGSFSHTNHSALLCTTY